MIASVALAAPATVQRYLRGEPITHSSRTRVERAISELQAKELLRRDLAPAAPVANG